MKTSGPSLRSSRRRGIYRTGQGRKPRGADVFVLEAFSLQKWLHQLVLFENRWEDLFESLQRRVAALEKIMIGESRVRVPDPRHQETLPSGQENRLLGHFPTGRRATEEIFWPEEGENLTEGIADRIWCQECPARHEHQRHALFIP
jgi:hypothetical protein